MLRCAERKWTKSYRSGLQARQRLFCALSKLMMRVARCAQHYSVIIPWLRFISLPLYVPTHRMSTKKCACVRMLFHTFTIVDIVFSVNFLSLFPSVCLPSSGGMSEQLCFPPFRQPVSLYWPCAKCMNRICKPKTTNTRGKSEKQKMRHRLGL